DASTYRAVASNNPREFADPPVLPRLDQALEQSMTFLRETNKQVTSRDRSPSRQLHEGRDEPRSRFSIAPGARIQAGTSPCQTTGDDGHCGDMSRARSSPLAPRTLQ